MRIGGATRWRSCTPVVEQLQTVTMIINTTIITRIINTRTWLKNEKQFKNMKTNLKEDTLQERGHAIKHVDAVQIESDGKIRNDSADRNSSHMRSFPLDSIRQLFIS